MRKELHETATTLSKTFMPAEHAQHDAALGAAESLVLALKLEKHRAFRGVDTGAAKEALAHGTYLAVQADEALRRAHREFAKVLPRAPQMEGWGCVSPDCGPGGQLAEVHELRSVA
jgi:hypothetical protein